MRFTTEQYDKAIAALQDGKKQLAPDGHCCAVCGDSGHQAFECGHNPLYAMFICQQIAGHAEKLHEALHYLAGYDTSMGDPIGPAKVVVPDKTLWCDICPHALALHNPDGSCGCGMDCATIRSRKATP